MKKSPKYSLNIDKSVVNKIKLGFVITNIFIEW